MTQEQIITAYKTTDPELLRLYAFLDVWQRVPSFRDEMRERIRWYPEAKYHPEFNGYYAEEYVYKCQQQWEKERRKRQKAKEARERRKERQREKLDAKWAAEMEALKKAVNRAND